VLLRLATQSCTWRRRGHGGHDRVSSVRHSVLSAVHDALSGSCRSNMVSCLGETSVNRRPTQRGKRHGEVCLAAPSSAWTCIVALQIHIISYREHNTQQQIGSCASSPYRRLEWHLPVTATETARRGPFPPPPPPAHATTPATSSSQSSANPAKIRASCRVLEKKPATRAIHPLTRLCRTCAQRRVGQIFLCAAGRL
jgi:hypothetical protein